jgi:inner membrane protein
VTQPLDHMLRLLRSPAFKLGLVGALILLLLVPLLIVHGLIMERESRAREVRADVGRTWGPEQRINGPFLVVPYTVRTEIVQGEKRIEQVQERRAIFTPEAVRIEGRTEARTLRRSIFEVPVYAARMRLSGRFATPRITDAASDVVAVRWREAAVVVGLSGVSGLKEAAVLRIAGSTDIPFSPSLGMPNARTTGIHARLEAAAAQLMPTPDEGLRAFEFAADLAFNGSVAIEAAPVAKDTVVAVTSDWPHPSFAGAFLPDERRIGADGFTATWRVPHLARSVPEAWSSSDAGIERMAPFSFGVRLIAPVDFYTLVNRATKYGLLLVTIIFMLVFTLELTSARPVHWVQYLFTGLALVLFYVLLLSLAEHIGFARAYLLSTAATGIMLATYIGMVMQSRRHGLIALAALTATYGLLYLVLQLEDYALLAGALLGFAGLATVMFATLRVDWSGKATEAPERA